MQRVPPLTDINSSDCQIQALTDVNKETIKNYKKIIKGWMIEEKWNPGSYDVGVYAESFPGDFFVMVDKAQQKLLGCILAPQYGENYGFVGLFMVDPNYRHCGLGTRLWNHAMDHLSKRNTTLYAVEAQIGRYAKADFAERGWTERYRSGEHPDDPEQTSTPISYDVPTEAIHSFSKRPKQNFDSAVQESEKIVLAEKVACWLENSNFKHINAEFIKTLLTHECISSVVKIHNETIVGLAVLRPCEKGDYRLSLFSCDAESATELANQVMRQVNFDAAHRDHYEARNALNIFMDTKPNTRIISAFAANMGLLPEVDVRFQVMCKQEAEEKSSKAESFSFFSKESSSEVAAEAETTEVAAISLEAG